MNCIYLLMYDHIFSFGLQKFYLPFCVIILRSASVFKYLWKQNHKCSLNAWIRCTLVFSFICCVLYTVNCRFVALFFFVEVLLAIFFLLAFICPLDIYRLPCRNIKIIIIIVLIIKYLAITFLIYSTIWT